MTTDNPTTGQAGHFSDRAKTIGDGLKREASQQLEVCEAKIRESPAKAFAVALGAGYILSRLPLAALIAAPLRITALAAKPALLILGAAKLFDLAEKQSRKR
ncbi:MAG: hypothetical protein V4640_11305 [Verrucomicrobiota bacterium]